MIRKLIRDILIYIKFSIPLKINMANNIVCAITLTLQPSQVIAPKWNPEDWEEHTEQGRTAIWEEIFFPPVKVIFIGNV